MPRPKAGRISRQPFVVLAVCLAAALGFSLAVASAAGAANGSSAQQSGRQVALHRAEHSADDEGKAARGSFLLTARAAGALQSAAPLSFETLRHVSRPGCDLFVTLNGFGYDPQNRPALGWSEASGCGGARPLRWTRLEGGAWVERTITDCVGCGGGIRAEPADFELRQDGTPFYAYAYPDAFIFGGTWYTSHFVDLNAQPNGHGSQVQPIDSVQSCISAHPAFAIDFAPGASSPDLLLGTRCAETGWLTLNGQTVHGSPPFRSPAGQNGEYFNLDYAAGPDGSHHVTYFSSRGVAGRGAYYSNGSPGNELRLAVPHLNRGAETSVAAGADGRIHVAIGGVPLCDNEREGGLLYLTSTDGANWTRTFVDRVSGRSPSLELDAAGRPRIAYYHLNEVRFASLDGGVWTTATVSQSAGPVKAVSVKLAYDTSDQPHVLFFDQTAADAGDIRISSGSPSNQPPSALNPGDQTGNPGSNASLQINATDAEGGALTYSACDLPPGLSINPSTGFISGTISPSAPAGGSYHVNVFVTDPAGNSAAVAFNWELANHAPPALANPGAQINAEGDTVSLQLAATDPDEDVLTFSAMGLPPGLSVNSATGLVSGSLGPNTSGLYHVSVTASDGSLSDTQAFDWTVNDTNNAPTAAADAYGTDEDVQLTLAAPGVLANDSDADGDGLTAQLVDGANPSAGTLVLHPDGSLAYTPGLNFSGAVSFSYHAVDGDSAASNVVSVTINVTPVNDAPSAADDSVMTDEDAAVTVDVLANDSDVDSDALSVAGVTPPAHGTAVVAPGGITYTPASNYSGPDSFTYTASDGHGGTGTATVTVSVHAVNDAPTVTDPGDRVSAEGDAVSLLVAAGDVDGDALTYSASGLPPGLSIDPATGLVAGTLGFDAAGGYGVSVAVGDGRGGTATATFNWAVTNVNRPPTALSFGQMLAEDTPQPLILSGVDPDGDALTFTVTAPPAHGTLSGTGASLTYTPAPNYNGPDSFAYTASDGALTSEAATVSLVVTPVADPPVLASVGDQTVAEGSLLMFTLTGSDPDGDTLTYDSSELPAGASLDASSGAFNWTPDFEQSGSYTVTFTVADPSGLSASETVTITVTDVVANRGPVCSGAYPSVAEIWPPNHKTTFPLEILGVADPDGDPVAVRVTSILQDEPTNTNGDGSTWVDGGGVGTAGPWVRAERVGTPKVPGNGRVYEIFFDASDGHGKSCTGSVKVGVPHDQGNKRVLVDDGKRYDSTVAGGACLNCP